jgi:hypothetical protein
MSLRETIEAAVNTAEEGQTAVVEQATPVQQTQNIEQTPAQQTATETAEEKAGRTAGRPRDEHGRLLPGKPEKPAIAPQVTQQAQAPQAQQEPSKPRIPPPSSWKKDHWQSWDKIASENPQLADYLNQREGEFAKGVSTYKQEYESVKPLADAIQPLMPILQQHGINPAQWITNMGNAHHSLVYGSPQEKLQMFAKLAQDYQVPIQALYDPQVQQQFLMQQQLHPQQPQPDVRALVQEQFTEMAAKTDLQQFEAARDSAGNPLYPHYDQVRNTMAQLLEAGIAQDLKSAYDKAIRMHDDIWQQEQEAKQAAAQNAVQIAQAKQVTKAKAAAVSPRTTTPGSVGAAQTTKGIRAALEASFDAHAGGGRV